MLRKIADLASSLSDVDRDRLKARQAKLIRDGVPKVSRRRRPSLATRRRLDAAAKANVQPQSRSFYNSVEGFTAPPARSSGPSRIDVSQYMPAPNPWRAETDL